MIEEVIADSQKTEDEAHASEADSQTAYEDFVKESNKSITQLTTSVNDMTVSLAKAKEDLTMAKSDLGGTMTELQGIQDYVTALHRECDYELTKFQDTPGSTHPRDGCNEGGRADLGSTHPRDGCNER